MMKREINARNLAQTNLRSSADAQIGPNFSDGAQVLDKRLLQQAQCETRPLQIPIAIEANRCRADELDKIVTHLEARLCAVMRPIGPDANGNKDERIMCGLADVLQQNA